MKKYLILTLSIITLSAAAIAQSATPRFGTQPNQDNTGRSLTYKFVAKTDVAGNDSVKSVPNAWHTIYRLTLTDSCGINVTSVANCYAGDQITVIASGASGTKVTFKGTNWIGAGTATLSALQRAVIRFVFDGTKWVEASRVVQ